MWVPWFGAIHVSAWPWVFHFETENWLCCFGPGASQNSYWMWDAKLSWLWTSNGTYPYMASFAIMQSRTNKNAYLKFLYVQNNYRYYENWSDGVQTTGNDSDVDSDGLPQIIEKVIGTSVTNADTDADGLFDGDEVLGTPDGIDLYGMGANPRRKTVLVECDWFEDNTDGASHSHKLSATARTIITNTFANAPVTNPDGSTGIDVFIDAGQGGVFTGGNKITGRTNGIINGDVFSSDFLGIKASNFNSNREGVFHYCVSAHSFNSAGNSGVAELPGNDLIISLQLYGTENAANQNIIANTFVHELGHNFGLRHGGSGHTPTYKPNFNSVMNYRYQFSGVDTNGDAVGDNVCNYSHGQYISINENSVYENMGVNGTTGIDWNLNGSISSSPYQRDLNEDGQFNNLTDYNDWANLNLRAVNPSAFGLSTGSYIPVCPAYHP